METSSISELDRCPDIRFGDFARKYQKLGVPVILPTLCQHWPAMQSWSLDALEAKLGDRIVHYAGEDIAFSAVIERIRAADRGHPQPYFNENHLYRVFPELLADVAPLPGNRHNRLSSKLLPSWNKYRDGVPEMLIAGTGTYFPVLHFDLHRFQAFITQIRGDKEFTLFPPDQGEYLYPRPEKTNLSQIVCFDPVDLQRFPLFAKAKPLRFVLREGETLFIPDGWWHYTRILSSSIAVTWNSVSASNWPRHTDEFYFGEVKPQPVKDLLKRLYLRALGLGFRLREALVPP